MNFAPGSVWRSNADHDLTGTIIATGGEDVMCAMARGGIGTGQNLQFTMHELGEGWTQVNAPAPEPIVEPIADQLLVSAFGLLRRLRSNYSAFDTWPQDADGIMVEIETFLGPAMSSQG